MGIMSFVFLFSSRIPTQPCNVCACRSMLNHSTTASQGKIYFLKYHIPPGGQYQK